MQSSVGKSGDGEPQAKPFVLEDGIQSWKVVQAVGQVADATVGKLLGFELSHYEELPLSLVQQSANNGSAMEPWTYTLEVAFGDINHHIIF